MTEQEKIAAIIELIKASELDETVKNILIRDLETDGLTDFMKEQIKAYCLESVKNLSKQMLAAKEALENSSEETTATL